MTRLKQAWLGEHPGESVHVVHVVKVGNVCFVAKDLKPIELQPKPKVAKGKRRNG